MLNVCLAEPRGFCAGVRRAVAIVEDALKKYGPPVYVRHEIVHNRHVIKTLEEQGAVFVGELDEADISRPLIFRRMALLPRLCPGLGKWVLAY